MNRIELINNQATILNSNIKNAHFKNFGHG